MTPTKRKLVEKLYDGLDPFHGFTPEPGDVDDVELFQWGSKHPLLEDSINKTNAKMIVESGTFRGGSAIHMAQILKQRGEDGVVVCIDTFLGCQHLFKHEGVKQNLKRVFGRPNLWRGFYANCIKYQVQDYIVPVHLDSQAGYKLLNGKHLNGFSFKDFDMAYVDSAHIHPMVYLDIKEAWDCLRPGGHLIGDDFIPNQKTINYHASDFRGVWANAVAFATENDVELEDHAPKFRMVKP